MSGTRSRLALAQISVRKSSAAVVVSSGSLDAEDCIISDCVHAAVEVRAGGSAALRHCTFAKCTKQAVTLYNGGLRLELSDCIVRGCGARPQWSAVLVECGVAALRRCTLEDNPSDAIVVQGNSPVGPLTSPVLLLDNCVLRRNYSGVSFYHGNGVLRSTTVADNAQYGCNVTAVPHGKILVLRSNVFQCNGPAGMRLDVCVLGHTLYRVAIQLDADNQLSAPGGSGA